MPPLTGLLTLFFCLVSGNPHLAWNHTWLIINAETGVIANSSSSHRDPKDTWFPDLYVDLCDLVGKTWNPSDHEPFPGYGCNSPGARASTRTQHFYVCPGHSRSKSQIQKCGGAGEAYCASWGCESTGRIWWDPPVKGDLIMVKEGNRNMLGTGYCSQNGKKVACGPCYKKEEFPDHPWATPGGKCNPLQITFTQQGKQADWTAGKTWGLRLYRRGWDPVLTFTIRRITSPIIVSVGPNQVLNPSGPTRKTSAPSTPAVP
ncbi:MLV-related proviral Env polyprotein-like isoform 1-T2 [Thomomys bottae]